MAGGWWLVAGDFHLRAYVDMVDTPEFNTDVIAHPAIMLIERAKPGPMLVAERLTINSASLSLLARSLLRGEVDSAMGVPLVEHAANGWAPLVLSSSAKRSLLRRLEAKLRFWRNRPARWASALPSAPTKPSSARWKNWMWSRRANCRWSAKAIASGKVRWLGLGVINPFEDDGKLAYLALYPKLHAHLERHHAAIAGRHIVKKAPANW